MTTHIQEQTQQTQPIKVDGRYFYNSKDLQVFKPEFYYGCTAKPRNIIIKKGIPNWEYIYATYEKSLKKWNPSTATCKKAQLLISKQWVDENYFKSSSSSSTIEKKKTIVIIKKSTLQQIQTQTQPTTPPPLQRDSEASATYEESEEEVLEEEGVKQEVENAPPVLHLDDGEKFHDADGTVIEIETRGERHEDKIYFKVKDVSVGFGMPNLNDTLIDKDRGYTRGTDYKIMFNRLSSVNDRCCTIKKCLFLTYEGLLRVLFVSRNKNATLFRRWATNKLFTIQMGTREQKVKLGAEILNTSPRTLKAVLDKHAANFPSIYLMSLGKVRDLRETFGIPADKPDDLTVYKFGFTEDLSRRVIELEKQYSKLQGVTMTLGTFYFVDPKYTSEAENKVRELCGAFEVRINKTVQGFNELVVLDDKQFTIVKDLYSKYGEHFAGATLALQKEIAILKDALKERDMIIRFKDELHEKEVQFYKKDGELKDTVIENWKLKHQLATMTNNAETK
uniref:Bro-N domain-containing protein n=1 Tax=viral metagenome TaxID=1070528 RepID=A0A6C0I2N9_9ZZZZ